MDLLEQTRRDDVYARMTKTVNSLNDLGVFPALVWLWAWDAVLTKLDYYQPDCGEYFCVNPKFTEKDVWDLFWDQADKMGFTLEYGTEMLDESVFDWMMDNDILIEDGLDEEDDVVVESGTEEVANG